MLNQAIVVGRLTDQPKIKELENGTKVCNITIAVPRSFKNSDGEYETDFIPCTLWKQQAIGTSEYCKKGDLIGIKGRLQFHGDKLEVVAEKVTYLASNNTSHYI